MKVSLCNVLCVFRVFAFFAMLVDVNDVDKKIERYFGERRH